MSEPLEYIIWFHKLFGSSKKGRKALEYYGNCKKIYEAVMSGNEKTGLTENSSPGKYESYSLIDALTVIEQCEINGWDIIPYTSEYYPKELLDIGNFPRILFAEGKKEILTRPVKISVVGSREAKEDAERVAYNAAFNLAKTGSVIVSGAALGIDSSAHLGALDSGGETVGILGCGLGNSYMERIGDFYDRVLENGVYITEMFPFENASRFSFPERNRLISGISRAVLVTCAAEKSGSLITAECARKQKRRVYAVAPEICFSKGCEQLLSGGAYYFYNAGDIAYPLREHYPKEVFNEYYCNAPVSAAAGKASLEEMALPKKKTKPTDKKELSVNKKNSSSAEKVKKNMAEEKKEKELPVSLSENAGKIYALLADSPVQRDSLVCQTGLRIPQVLSALSELETVGLIKSIPGGRIEKIN